MSDTIEEKIKNYRTAPFDARFPNTNQTRNCYQNYLGYPVRTVQLFQQQVAASAVSHREIPQVPPSCGDYHRCNKALSAKDQDTAPCDWYQRVYKSLCPNSWVQKWDDQLEGGSFAGKI